MGFFMNLRQTPEDLECDGVGCPGWGMNRKLGFHSKRRSPREVLPDAYRTAGRYATNTIEFFKDIGYAVGNLARLICPDDKDD